MSTFGSGSCAADTFNNENHSDNIENREIFESYAYSTFGTLAARRIVEDVQDIRDVYLLSLFLLLDQVMIMIAFIEAIQSV